MDLDKLKERISRMEYIHVKVMKAGTVFTVFLRGKGLSNMKTVFNITDICLSSVGENYPFIEVMINDSDSYLLVLKQNNKIIKS